MLKRPWRALVWGRKVCRDWGPGIYASRWWRVIHFWMHATKTSVQEVDGSNADLAVRVVY